MVLLAPSPSSVRSKPSLLSVSNVTEGQASERGVFVRHALGGGETANLLFLADAVADQPLAALIPLDVDAPDRLHSVSRLMRGLLGRTIPSDARLTPQRRRRLRNMLQAVDGRANGASYREIAEVLFGKDRVATEAWKTSALRDATMDLVKDGLAMIAGGYRALLRHRRRS
ncbi:DUF2285 domain-containing protein [Sinorhizobium garamanticum]|uniref:DUF2285 domain-containing protein n=1 Tax=Sinorhizobium garamanticum TaxID=680247 RepID=A0ABY8D7G3_9HYPH|nr:DUF2285 domain-containing protein [Sinorhizobium garamanticum]WEX85778.1 DUF2285 domain-containing protein [Sinorhizobium garamanticum]